MYLNKNPSPQVSLPQHEHDNLTSKSPTTRTLKQCDPQPTQLPKQKQPEKPYEPSTATSATEATRASTNMKLTCRGTPLSLALTTHS